MVDDNNSPLGATLNVAAPNFGTVAGWGFGNGLWYDEDSESFSYAAMTDGYQELVEYFASLVADGLLDPESLTQDDDTAIQKFGSGQSLAIGGNTQEVTTLRARRSPTRATPTPRCTSCGCPAGPAGDNVASGSRAASGFMLSSEVAEQPELPRAPAVRGLAVLLRRGPRVRQVGRRGHHVHRRGRRTRTLAADVDWNGVNPAGTKKLNADFGFSNGVWSLANGSTDTLDPGAATPRSANEFVEAMADKTELPLTPSAPLDEMQQEQVTLWQSALNDSVTQNTAAFILGRARCPSGTRG